MLKHAASSKVETGLHTKERSSSGSQVSSMKNTRSPLTVIHSLMNKHLAAEAGDPLRVFRSSALPSVAQKSASNSTRLRSIRGASSFILPAWLRELANDMTEELHANSQHLSQR